MEDMYNLKTCPWVTSEPVNLKEYFHQYQASLDEFLGKPYNEEDDHVRILQQLFPITIFKEEGKAGSDPYDIGKLEKECSVDLLTVDAELPPQDTAEGSTRFSGSVSNWFAGSFQDSVIPEEGKSLNTLQDQDHELKLRLQIQDYSRLRNRQLKYYSTVRVAVDKDKPQPIPADQSKISCHREIVLNVRVQRPFYKKLHWKKPSSKFPSHSQELLVLGSQKLTKLRDTIVCTNDCGVNRNLSDDAKLSKVMFLPNNAKEYPSGCFYINRVIYDDTRHPESKRYSENIMKWAQKNGEIGPLRAAKMEDTCFEDLSLQLGYPYLYMHQGKCEHLIVFTDARLHHKDDSQNIERYPIQRGQACKLSVKCKTCGLRLANWIVKDDPRLASPDILVCDNCLRFFFYNRHGAKIHNIQVYPFNDEFLPLQKKNPDALKE